MLVPISYEIVDKLEINFNIYPIYFYINPFETELRNIEFYVNISSRLN